MTLNVRKSENTGLERSSAHQRATKERQAREQNTTNDMCAELTAYLRENLLMIDYEDSSECQAEVILKWWKVRHRQCSYSMILLTSNFHRTMLLAIRYSAALPLIIYQYKVLLFHASVHSPMLGSQILSGVHVYFQTTLVLSKQSRVGIRRSGDIT